MESGKDVKLLLIEDERRIAEALTRELVDIGHEVELCHDGEQGLACAQAGSHHLIVLDIMLPGMDGWDVLTRLRGAKSTPVLLLSARDRVEDKVRGLGAGADDYLAKPFAFPELLARCEALARRARRSDDALQVADLSLDPLERRVCRAGRRVALSQKEFSLLLVLMRHRGEVLTRAMIASAVWGIDFDTDTNTVDVAIRRLRVKMDEGYGTTLIHTVRGVGYCLDLRT